MGSPMVGLIGGLDASTLKLSGWLLVEGLDVLCKMLCAIFFDDGDCMAVIGILNAIVPCWKGNVFEVDAILLALASVIPVDDSISFGEDVAEKFDRLFCKWCSKIDVGSHWFSVVTFII